LTSEDVESLTQNVREDMLKELVSLTAKARGEPIALPAKSSRDGVVKASGAKVQ
jgi:lysophosphatidate acyltransferase